MNMDISQKFKIIQEYYKTIDEEMRKEHGKPFFDTPYGIWGASSTLDAYELFLQLHLEDRKGFADLGSGDGRIVLIAALFTNSCGIEGDKQLHEIAERAKLELAKQIPELDRCTLRCSDYTKEDLSHFEILFTFADHPWNKDFEEKLKRECTGVLLSYNRIFLPTLLVKGKTYWMQQLPIVSYPLNTEDKDLLQR